MDGERLRADLHLAWNRQLYHWWDYYDQEYLGGAMRRPVIELSQARGEWGRWDGGGRRLFIARHHIETSPWIEVMETLRHEMAHQYAGEVLRPVGEPPHGPAFRRACEKLRCSPKGRGAVAPGAQDESVLRRIKKVLSLTDSPNEHEAQVAVDKARDLLLEYNIDLVELDRARSFSCISLGPVKKRRDSHEAWLAALLQRFFFVETLWAYGYEPGIDKSGSVLQVYGTPTNLHMARYVYDYLSQLLERLWQQYRQANQLPGNRERRRYFTGVLEGFYRKLEAGVEERAGNGAQSRALVWRGDARLQTYFRYLNPRVRTRQGRGVSASPAYRDGLEEGGKVTIRRPLEAQRDGFGGYLTGE
ncbi:MAG: DUF2786 domain-containing protein [Candidatus Latescibacteria bacterium]|nr:DUF2786 domain-containing protein [Candidatus Latescibacterota bacterium]